MQFVPNAMFGNSGVYGWVGDLQYCVLMVFMLMKGLCI